MGAVWPVGGGSDGGGGADAVWPEGGDSAGSEAADTERPEGTCSAGSEAVDAERPERAGSAGSEAADTVRPDAEASARSRGADVVRPEGADCAGPEDTGPLRSEDATSSGPEAEGAVRLAGATPSEPEPEDAVRPEDATSSGPTDEPPSGPAATGPVPLKTSASEPRWPQSRIRVGAGCPGLWRRPARRLRSALGSGGRRMSGSHRPVRGWRRWSAESWRVARAATTEADLAPATGALPSPETRASPTSVTGSVSASAPPPPPLTVPAVPIPPLGLIPPGTRAEFGSEPGSVRSRIGAGPPRRLLLRKALAPLFGSTCPAFVHLWSVVGALTGYGLSSVRSAREAAQPLQHAPQPGGRPRVLPNPAEPSAQDTHVFGGYPSCAVRSPSIRLTAASSVALTGARSSMIFAKAREKASVIVG